MVPRSRPSRRTKIFHDCRKHTVQRILAGGWVLRDSDFIVPTPETDPTTPAFLPEAIQINGRDVIGLVYAVMPDHWTQGFATEIHAVETRGDSQRTLMLGFSVLAGCVAGGHFLGSLSSLQ
jgi:hypothetical protein